MYFSQGFLLVLLNRMFRPFMARRMRHRWRAYLISGVLIGVMFHIPASIVSSFGVARNGPTLWIVLDVI